MAEVPRSARPTVIADPNLLPEAHRRAAERRQVVYLHENRILDERPLVGPFLVIYPGGTTEAVGLGRKRERRRRS